MTKREKQLYDAYMEGAMGVIKSAQQPPTSAAQPRPAPQPAPVSYDPNSPTGMGSTLLQQSQQPALTPAEIASKVNPAPAAKGGPQAPPQQPQQSQQSQQSQQGFDWKGTLGKVSPTAWGAMAGAALPLLFSGGGKKDEEGGGGWWPKIRNSLLGMAIGGAIGKWGVPWAKKVWAGSNPAPAAQQAVGPATTQAGRASPRQGGVQKAAV